MSKAERERDEQPKETAATLSCTTAWVDGGTGGSWAPHGDIMVFVGELVVELEGCVVDGGSSSALQVLQRVIFKACATRA